MRRLTVDVLFVDEAAQMSLANVLAVSQAAKTVVLIGDPQQLDQPMQGSHPEGTDVSALPEGVDTPAHRTLSMIAKEGRKYGTGLMLVTQRPSEIDSAILSQCGSMIALRLTNSADRSKVSAAVPDDLGGLVDQLPSLRTGEGVFLGEVMPIPSRVRVRKAKQKPVGDDPKLPDVWQVPDRPDGNLYTQALANWRAQSTSAEVDNNQDEDEGEPGDA